LVALSIPPASIALASPSLILSAASITVRSPEPHLMFTVNAGTDWSIPALNIAFLAGFAPTPACHPLPMITSSTTSAEAPERTMFL
jgi:hypothetical protein